MNPIVFAEINNNKSVFFTLWPKKKFMLSDLLNNYFSAVNSRDALLNLIKKNARVKG